MKIVRGEVQVHIVQRVDEAIRSVEIEGGYVRQIVLEKSEFVELEKYAFDYGCEYKNHRGVIYLRLYQNEQGYTEKIFFGNTLCVKDSEDDTSREIASNSRGAQ